MLWLQLAGLKWEPAPSKGVNTYTVPRGLIIPEGREITVLAQTPPTGRWAMGARKLCPFASDQKRKGGENPCLTKHNP